MTPKQVLAIVPKQSPLGDPLPFSPPSMARQAPPPPEEEAEYSVIESEPEPAPIEEDGALSDEEMMEAAEKPEIAATPEPEPDPEPEPKSEEPALDHLVQKLGITLEKHREWSARRKAEQAEAPQFPRAVTAPAVEGPAFVEREFDMAAPAEAAQAMAAFFAPESEAAPAAPPAAATPASALPASAMPPPAIARQMRPFAGMNPLDDGEDDELDQLAASFSLPIKRAEPAPENEPYSPPTGTKNPFRGNRPEFVRVEEPEHSSEAVLPAVVFPHDEPAAAVRAFDRTGPVGISAAHPGNPATARPGSQRPSITSDDNDRVLREALMNLQRIGKV